MVEDNSNMPKTVFPGKVGLQQRVLPSYRTPFFDLLADRCQGGLSVFAGKPRAQEAILITDQLDAACYAPAGNIHLLNGPLYLCLQTGLKDWLNKWNPDVLILEANPRYLSNRQALTWMRERGRPVIGWGLGITAQGPLIRRVWPKFLKHFSALIAYSSWGAEQYQIAGFPAEDIFVAANAVAPPPPLRPRSPIKNRAPRVLFVGRLQTRKRIDLLLHACSDSQLAPELCIVGDGPARNEIEQLANRTYPSARFAGALQGTRLEKMFKWADLFVLPGTGGLALQEAMAHGLPVIAAEADGTQKDLVSPSNGWLVPPGDLDALTAVLRAALGNPEQLRIMGIASHRLVSEGANLDKMANTFIRALCTATGQGA